MNLPTPIRFSRLLLYVEWILLCLTLLTALVFQAPESSIAFLVLPTIVLFGVMGLRLPTRNLIHKLFYIALEFGIISLIWVLTLQPHSLPILCIIVVIRGCQMFGLMGRLIVAGTAFLLHDYILLFVDRANPIDRLRDAAMHQPPGAALGNMLKLNAIVSYGLLLMFVLLLVNALLVERQSREKLIVAHEQLRHYALRIEDQATLQERNRIAREIHDALGHTLTAQSIHLETALLSCPLQLEETRDLLLKARQLGSQALQEVRQSVATLRTDPLQGQSLETAIEVLVYQVRSLTNLEIEWHIALPQPLPREMNTAMYRILQEALTNICKHSAATAVVIRLTAEFDHLRLAIVDNGRGFNPAQNTTGFGLQAMRERTMELGGQFHLLSRLGTGCRIEAIVPLPTLSSVIEQTSTSHTIPIQV